MKILPNTIVYLHEIQNQKWLENTLLSLNNKYNLVRAQDFEHYYYNNCTLKHACHITFDDGDLSFYNNVMPVIKKHKIPVSTYVSPLIAQERSNFWFQEIRGYKKEKLSEIIKVITNHKIQNIQSDTIKAFLKTLRIEIIWEIIRVYQKETNTSTKPTLNMTDKQLIEIKSSGLVEIGSHTLNHPILVNETDDNAKIEIEKSIERLSDILNCETRYFVYPNGDYGEREINILKNTGIKLAFSTKREKISHGNNIFSIPRSGSPIISEFHNNPIFNYSKSLLLLLSGETEYYKYSKVWNSRKNIKIKSS